MKQLSRAQFLKMLLAGAVLAPELTSFGTDFDHLRGDRVGWARLKTANRWWKRHAGADPTLTDFFRSETALNIDPIWYAADVNRMDELCKYPLLFSQNVAVVADQPGRENVAEYIRRGGFILVDACHAIEVNPDYEEFWREQIAFYSAVLPEAQIVPLPPTHDIYRCYFQIPDGNPPFTFMSNVYDPRKVQHRPLGVMIGSRIAGLISICGWQCGWDHVTQYPSPSPPGTDVACMRMVVNIYVYAMMQGA
jgi:Domain of unknown function (DUF4159)